MGRSYSVRLNVEIKEGIYSEFKRFAEAEGRSMADVVRVLVNGWISDKRIESELPKDSNERK